MGHTTRLELFLDRMHHPDAAVRRSAQEELIAHTCKRLRLLARKMLGCYPNVHRWAETDDVLQGALLRLHRALAEVRPETSRQFYSLAAMQIRRELLDLARHYYGPNGWGRRHQSNGHETVLTVPDGSLAPGSLEEWSRFHEEVEALPEEQKEVVNLLWYGGLRQAEAAQVLGISHSTLKRLWRKARVRLGQRLEGLQRE